MGWSKEIASLIFKNDMITSKRCNARCQLCEKRNHEEKEWCEMTMNLILYRGAIFDRIASKLRVNVK